MSMHGALLSGGKVGVHSLQNEFVCLLNSHPSISRISKGFKIYI